MADVLIAKRTTILIVEQPTTTGASVASHNGRETLEPEAPHRFAPTATTQGTTTHAGLLTGGATVYVGDYLEALDGDHKGQMVQVHLHNGAGVLTHEKWPTATNLPTEVKLWRPAEPVVVVTSQTVSGGTTITATGRKEGARYWGLTTGDTDPAPAASNNKKYLLIGRGSGNDNKAYEIKSWANATNVFTLDTALSANAEIGDLFVIRKAPVQADLEAAFTTAHAQREPQRATLAGLQGVPMTRGASVVFSTDLKGSGVAGGNNSRAIPPLESGSLLDMMTAETVDKGSLVGAGSAQDGTPTPKRTDVKITTATHERFTVGNFVLVNGELAVIQSKTDGGVGVDTLAVEPQLGTVPASGDVCYASTTWAPADTGHLGLFAEIWAGDAGVWRCWGGKSDIKIDGLATDQIPKLRWAFAMADFTENFKTGSGAGAAPSGLPTGLVFDTTLPLDSKALRVVLDDTVLAAVRSAVVTVGYDVKPRAGMSNGRAGEIGTYVATRTSKIELVVDYEDHAHLRAYYRGKVVNCLVQHGTVAGQTFGVYARRAELDAPPAMAVDDGRYTLALSLHAIETTVTGFGDLLLGSA